jgi:hypothetical protein
MSKYAIVRKEITTGHVRNTSAIGKFERNYDETVRVYDTREAAQARIDEVHAIWREHGYHCAQNELGFPELSVVAL